uniref:Ig-like domain-containing protein n=1 Tax=Astyanax mexicanus TaxID=7994 RepID=A0A3B1IZF6_ASTMX
MFFFSCLRQHSRLPRLLWLLLYGSEMLWTCLGMSVNLPYKSPIYVSYGRKLALQAQVTKSPAEILLLVTWDVRNGEGEFRLDTNKSPDPDNVHLQIAKVERYGSYIVTVTDSHGDQTYASVEVRKSTNPPKASVSMLCSIIPEGPMWDSPVFSWWVNGIKVTNQTAHLSSDGSRIHLVNTLANNYTCVVDSSQGSSTVQINTGTVLRTMLSLFYRSTDGFK